MNTKIGITGATGNLGRATLKYLKNLISKEEIVLFVHNKDKAKDFIDYDVRVIDYDNKITLKEKLKGINKLFLISSSELLKDRVAQHKNVIEAAKEIGVNHLFYTSFYNATNSINPIARDHILTEELLNNSLLPHTILRNSLYLDMFAIQDVLSGVESGEIIKNAGDGYFALPSIDNLGEAAAILLASNNQLKNIYELTGTYKWNFNELANIASQVFNKNIVYKSIDDTTMENIYRSFMPKEIAKIISGFGGAMRANEYSYINNDLKDIINKESDDIRTILMLAADNKQ